MILAFVSRKGGVGKTTSVVSLGGALVRLGHKVLIVDLDSQASASLSLGFQRAQLAPSIHDVLFRRLSLADAVRPTGIERLELVTASADLLAADLDLLNLRRRDELLTEALRPQVERWDWILLDCPPSLTGIVRNALVAADGWVLPTPPHYLAYEGVDVLIDAAERLLRRFGRRDAFAGILLTMIDYRTSAARAHAAELRMRYGLKVFDTEIPVNVRLAESPLAGRTIFESDPKASGAHAYRMLAVELLDRFKVGRDEAATPSAAVEDGESTTGRTSDLAELPTPSDQPN